MRRQSACLAVAFTALTVACALHWLDGIDRAVERGFAADEGYVVYVIASALAITASLPAAALWGGVILAASAARPQRRWKLWGLAAAVTAVQVAELILKLWIIHAPPPVVHRAVLPQGPYAETPGSYPSGHMARAVVMFLGPAIVMRWRSRLVIGIGVLLSISIAWTRLVLGDHWASDVAGGALLSFAVLVLVRDLCSTEQGKSTDDRHA